MLRRTILGLAAAAGLALTGCGTTQAAARGEAGVLADSGDDASGTMVAAARQLRGFEDLDPAGVYAPKMVDSLANDSQDPIPIMPSPNALQSGDGSGRFKVGGHNPVARTER